MIEEKPAPAKDDCFAFPSRRLRHAEAVALLSRLDFGRRAVEKVSIFEARGRICAEPLYAPRPVPAHTNAAVDGYAFNSRDYDRANGTLFPLQGRAAAGDAQLSTAKGAAARTFTGAIMPDGADTVAMQEDCTVREGGVFVPPGLKAGANRRCAGEDVAEGATVIPAGAKVRPQDLAALAASGYDHVPCIKPVRVLILSTGNEVLLPGAPFGEGKVYDANGPMLKAILEAAGADVSYGGILPDSRASVEAALREGATRYDLIVTSGGASLGEEDHVISSLRQADALTLWQLAIKPGRPMGLGKIGSCVCFALPGNPVAVFVCALIYLWPLLHRAAGGEWREPQRIWAQAAFSLANRKMGRREFFRGTIFEKDRQSFVAKYERDGSGLISSLRESNGLIEIPEEIEAIARDDPVAFIPFSQFGIF